jgi:hypothetical protein
VPSWAATAASSASSASSARSASAVLRLRPVMGARVARRPAVRVAGAAGLSPAACRLPSSVLVLHKWTIDAGAQGQAVESEFKRSKLALKHLSSSLPLSAASPLTLSNWIDPPCCIASHTPAYLPLPSSWAMYSPLASSTRWLGSPNSACERVICPPRQKLARC